MSGLDDRRKDLRYTLPIRLWFNILKSRQSYIRGASVIPSALERSGHGPGLIGRDDLEQFLLRLEAKVDFILSLMADNLVRKEYSHKAAVLDVSESGAKIYSPIELKEGAVLEIGIYIPSQPYRIMDLAGEVVWVDDTSMENPDEGEGWLVGIKFIDIIQQDQDQIVRWIFDKQREEIRRSREKKENEELLTE
jgi:hypothetical protein